MADQRPFRSGRLKAEWLKPSDRIKLAAKLRELWAADPSLTVEQVLAATEAPLNVVQDVRRRLIAIGVLPKLKAGAKTLTERRTVAERRAAKLVADAINGGFASVEDFTDG